MMIGLPNADGSFTCTLFWPFEGPASFATIRSDDDLLRFFDEQFRDAVPLMPTLVEDYYANPIGSLVTIRCGPWYVEDRVVLLGDACHAVVPFYGQGMNAAFEDVLVLAECLEQGQPDFKGAFADYYRRRKRDADTLAELAIGNFIEMRDHTGSQLFLIRKKLETRLHKLFPRWYIPLYTMVTFTRMSYADAVARARLQDRVVVATAGLVILMLLLVLIVL